MNEYLEIVQHFKEIWPREAEDLIAAQNGDVIFIGKPECPYCQKFIPKLKEVVDKYHLNIHYIFSMDKDHAEEIMAFRKKYGIETVPSLIYAGEETKVRNDSGMTIKEIEQHLQLID